MIMIQQVVTQDYNVSYLATKEHLAVFILPEQFGNGKSKGCYEQFTPCIRANKAGPHSK